jgi:hypothetical protein
MMVSYASEPQINAAMKFSDAVPSGNTARLCDAHDPACINVAAGDGSDEAA